MSELDSTDRIFLNHLDTGEILWCEDDQEDLYIQSKEFVSIEFVEKLWGQCDSEFTFLEKLRGTK